MREYEIMSDNRYKKRSIKIIAKVHIIPIKI